MKMYVMPDPKRSMGLSTQEMREAFLMEDLFAVGEIRLAYCDVDRTIVGSAVPGGKGELVLGTADELRAEFFLQRRELGILNIGGKGTVMADGKPYEMDNLDCLYVGRGVKEVRFASGGAEGAQYYLVSYPAHATYPTTQAKKAHAAAVPLGSQATANKRTIYKYIHMEGIKSCQLVMGFTVLEEGSVWNTMPPHTHARRSEIYMYFNMKPDTRVMHFMGEPQETRHLVVADRQAVISPSWSIHAGCGTTNYAFCWAMGGENQAFDDMDAAPVATLK
jgi:4-deoxy-L-threo-5-hexosulose-uronate ketol-isomerase